MSRSHVALTSSGAPSRRLRCLSLLSAWQPHSQLLPLPAEMRLPCILFEQDNITCDMLHLHVE